LQNEEGEKGAASLERQGGGGTGVRGVRDGRGEARRRGRGTGGGRLSNGFREGGEKAGKQGEAGLAMG
jgi:hypothetical protein